MPNYNSAHEKSRLCNEEIRNALVSFGIRADEIQLRGIRGYLELLLKWNQAMSLTTITDPVEIVRRHFGESMFASTLVPVENCRLADVGSGAGFPGLAIKIAYPSVDLILIESNKKKCAFLSEAVRQLDLQNIRIIPERYDDIPPGKLRVDVITSRALGNLKCLLEWSEGVLNLRGQIVLWLGAEDTTLIAKRPGWVWEPPVRIPESRGRFILIGRPIRTSSIIR